MTIVCDNCNKQIDLDLISIEDNTTVDKTEKLTIKKESLDDVLSALRRYMMSVEDDSISPDELTMDYDELTEACQVAGIMPLL